MKPDAIPFSTWARRGIGCSSPWRSSRRPAGPRQLWDHYELPAPGPATDACAPRSCRSRPTMSGLVTVSRCATTSSSPPARCCSRWTRPVSNWPCGKPRAAVARAGRRARQPAHSHRAGSARETRNAGLGELVSQELRERVRARLDRGERHAARGGVALRQAQVALDTARLNLRRTQVHAPADGLVTNLDLRQGRLRECRPSGDGIGGCGVGLRRRLVSRRTSCRASTWATAMPRGAGRRRARRQRGEHRGRHRRSRSAQHRRQLLPSVNPRPSTGCGSRSACPVRVKLDAIPAGARLVAGQTVTVQVLGASAAPETRGRRASLGLPG